MKKINLLLSLVVSVEIIQAQTTVSDSIDLGANSSNMVFYSLSGGSKTSVNAQDWDLQFGTNFQSASIRINDGINNTANVALYKLQSADTANWGYPVDTTGMTRLYNSDTTWEVGALNNQQLPCTAGTYNFGWGCYDFTSHNVTGSEVYVIKTINGSYQQIWVRNLIGSANTYEIRFADLDGSNSQTVSVNRNPFSAKSSFYYAIESDEIKDTEPQKTEWDLVFRRYETFVTVPIPSYYTVTGVLLNGGVTAAEARNADPASNEYSGYPFESNISVIGYDWKSQTTIVDSLVYFVQAQDGYIYKLVFTGYSGLATGKIYFNKTQLVQATSVRETSNIRALALLPNPATEHVQAVFTLMNESDVTIKIFDLSGKSHFNTRTLARAGVNVLTLSTAQLARGFYLLSVDDGSNQLTYKLIKD